MGLPVPCDGVPRLIEARYEVAEAQVIARERHVREPGDLRCRGLSIWRACPQPTSRTRSRRNLEGGRLREGVARAFSWPAVSASTPSRQASQLASGT
jgi:hypothetical protein